MRWNEFEGLVYFDGVFGDQYSDLPGTELWQFLQAQTDNENNELLQAKLLDCCRKLAMMWFAGDKVLATEADFYASTLKEAPALFAIVRTLF